jgi:hypothetical protein
MKFSWMSAPVFLCMLDAQSLEFSRAEWDNPGLAGSSVWLRNDETRPVRIEALFVRDNGIHKYNEIALKAGSVKRYFKVTKPAHGQWARLTPVDGKAVKLRIRAKDSMLVQEFEYGNKLRVKKAKQILADQYVLDLKAIDNTGDSSVVKISQASDSYYIGVNGSWNESDQDED